jgi:hypothetical protein
MRCWHLHRTSAPHIWDAGTLVWVIFSSNAIEGSSPRINSCKTCASHHRELSFEWYFENGGVSFKNTRVNSRYYWKHASELALLLKTTVFTQQICWVKTVFTIFIVFTEQICWLKIVFTVFAQRPVGRARHSHWHRDLVFFPSFLFSSVDVL